MKYKFTEVELMILQLLHDVGAVCIGSGIGKASVFFPYEEDPDILRCVNFKKILFNNLDCTRTIDIQKLIADKEYEIVNSDGSPSVIYRPTKKDLMKIPKEEIVDVIMEYARDIPTWFSVPSVIFQEYENDIKTGEIVENANYCISCGAVIPEGRWMCPACEKREGK